MELLSVPRWTQGAFDGLCAYYTGAMMLATLVPEYEAEFGRATTNAVRSMSRDPLFRQYGGDEDDRVVVARWFHRGENIDKVVAILNRNMRYEGLATRFEYLEMDLRNRPFERIKRSIDDGLPVMLGWDTEDYGCHAVLVTGYWLGREKWLTVNDPGGANSEVSWDSLKVQRKRPGKFEVGVCVNHVGPRPMKSITDDRMIPDVHQWTPQQKYERVVDQFADAGWTGLRRVRPWAQ